MIVSEGKGRVPCVKGFEQTFGEGEHPIDLLAALPRAVTSTGFYAGGSAGKTTRRFGGTCVADNFVIDYLI